MRTRVDAEIDGGWHVVVAHDREEVLGFVAMLPDQAKLAQIFVTPEWLGQGIGKSLMAAAAQAMPGGFTLWTHGDNVRARRFYEGLSPLRREDGMHPTHGHPIRTYWFAGA